MKMNLTILVAAAFLFSDPVLVAQIPLNAAAGTPERSEQSSEVTLVAVNNVPVDVLEATLLRLQFGSVFQATPRVGDHAVLLEFSFEKSESVPPSDDSEAPASIVTTSTQSAVRIPQGQSVVSGGLRMGPDGKLVRWKLIVSTNVE